MVHVTPKPILVGERLQQLDMLLHVQEFSSMIAVITGGAEMGKTALLESAVSQLSIHHQVITFSATNYQTENQVLSLVSEQLNSDASWISIEEVLSDIHSQNESVSLLIDDAHFLPFELLEMLSARAASEDGWHLAVAGEASLYGSLTEIERDLHLSNLIHHIDLMVITEVEAVDLAEAYFKREGLSTVPISAQKVSHHWKLAEGIPGRLIGLFEGEKDEKIIESARFPFGHVAAICLIATALSFSYFYQGDAPDDIDAIEQILVATSSLEVSSSKEAGKEGVANSLLEVRHKESLTASVEAPFKQSGHAAKEISTEISKEKPVASLQKVIPKEEPVLSLASKSVEKASADALPSGVDKKHKFPPHPLLNAPSSGFALQLLGVRSRGSAEKVMSEFKQALGSEQLSVYETKYQGQPWFVVVYGPINNKKNARQKAGSIAKALNNKPWVRPMAKIQEDIRRIQP